MEIYKQVDKYFWENVINDRLSPGIFLFDEVSAYIKTSVKNRKNLSPYKFIAYIKEQRKDNFEYYLDLIHKITQEDKSNIEKVIDKRLTNAFIGLFGEAILESMYEKSDKYEVIPVSGEEDYSLRIDIKIKQKKSNKILNLQVKSSSFYYSPTQYQIQKMENENQIHKENKLIVTYAFYNHSFKERHFMIEENMVPIYGYGNSNIKILESITDLIIDQKDNLGREKVTVESIIF